MHGITKSRSATMNQGREHDETTFKSVRDLADLRRLAVGSNQTRITRPFGSNLDTLEDLSSGDKLAVCNLLAFQPFTDGSRTSIRLGFEHSVPVVLAAHHLNTGDGSLVPQVQGLNDRCPIRFMVEMVDTEFSGGPALRNLEEVSKRDPLGPVPQPCGIVGAFRSAVSIPSSIISGFLGIPQISGGSTSTDLDDTLQYPLFGRTVPSDAGTAITVIRFFREVLQAQHLAVIHINDAYG